MPDLEFSNQGSVFMCAVLTEAGQAWVGEHVPTESWQWMGQSFAVEPRYAVALAKAARDDGLEVA